METKICSRCKRELPATEFYKNASAKDGLQTMCKECAREYNRRQYARNTSKEGGGRTAPFSDPDFDGKTIREVMDMMSRAKRYLESRGCVIRLSGEFHETIVKQLKF